MERLAISSNQSAAILPSCSGDPVASSGSMSVLGSGWHVLLFRSLQKRRLPATVAPSVMTTSFWSRCLSSAISVRTACPAANASSHAAP
ncbi:hypothetical protein ABZ858_36110 [Streptomyces sp. NPDC047017]|uniref:hypothetical protein n=1 Tax=Streptomyces sp. NPDC047017 TaxID=3155024 RepID=UPI00340248DE